VVPARYRSKAASSGWVVPGSSQMYIERMKSTLSMLWASCSGGASTLNGSSMSMIVVSGKDEDRQMGVGLNLGARVDD